VEARAAAAVAKLAALGKAVEEMAQVAQAEGPAVDKGWVPMAMAGEVEVDEEPAEGVGWALVALVDKRV